MPSHLCPEYPSFTSLPLETLGFKALLTLIHSFTQEVFLRAYYVPDTVMGTRDIMGKLQPMSPSYLKLWGDRQSQ